MWELRVLVRMSNAFLLATLDKWDFILRLELMFRCLLREVMSGNSPKERKERRTSMFGQHYKGSKKGLAGRQANDLLNAAAVAYLFTYIFLCFIVVRSL